MASDPWTVLGVAPSATYAEVRRAYLVRSQLLHPDRHQGSGPDVMAEAERAMRELNDAWNTVRARFDPTGEAAEPDAGEAWRDGDTDRQGADRAESGCDDALDPETCLDWVLRRLADAARRHGDPLSPEELRRLRLPVAVAPTGRRFEHWLAHRRTTLRDAVADDSPKGEELERWTRSVRVLSESRSSVVFMLLLEGRRA